MNAHATSIVSREKMPFEFFNSAVIDSDARKRIRRHVMIGKNSGKTRPPRAKRLIPRCATVLATKPLGMLHTPPDHESLYSESEDRVVAVGRQVVSEMAMWPFPTKCPPASQRAIYAFVNILGESLYPPEFCAPLNFVNSVWFQYVFVDEAYFHCTLALALVCIDFYLSRQPDSAQAMSHVSNTLRLINKKLSGAEALSDSTFAVVVCMCIYERLRGQYDKGLVHLQGLQRMIQLRGGISQLISNSSLVRKIFRVDIEFALYYGSSTRFSLHDVPGQEVISELRNAYNRDNIAIGLSFLDSICPDTQDSLMDILSLDYYFKSPRARLDPEDFQAILLRIGYKLLQLTPWETLRTTNCFEHLLRLGMTAFLTAFWHEYGRTPSRFPLLHDSLRTAVENTIHIGFRDQILLLWILLANRASVFTNTDEPWMIPIIARVSMALGLDTWEDARRILHNLPWISLLHEKPGKMLWDKTSRRQKEIGPL